MAVVLPIFLLVLLGIMEFGRAYMVEHVVASAARRGARLAVLKGTTNSQVEQACEGYCANALGVSTEHVTVTIEDGGGAADLANAATGDVLTISVSVPYGQVSYLPAWYLSGAQLSSDCTMEHE
jgi:Flp pilus assembly protein TadG